MMYCAADQNQTCTLIVFYGVSMRSRFGCFDKVWAPLSTSPSRADNINPFYERDYSTNLYLDSFEKFVEELTACVEDFNYWHSSNIPFSTRAIVQFTTVSTQVSAEKFLEQFGVPRVVGPIFKRKHPEGKLSLWAMPVKEFLALLDKHKKDLNIK